MKECNENKSSIDVYAKFVDRLRYKNSFSFILLSLLFCVCFYDAIAKIGITYTDELLVLYLFVCWLFKGEKNNELICFLYISFFFLIYGVIQGTNVLPAIFTDFFIEIKPYLAFYTAYSLNISLTSKEQSQFRYLCLIFALALLPIGINFSLGGDWIYTMPGHPSRYASIYQMLGIVYLFFSRCRKDNYYIAAIIIACSLFSLRSKAFGFFVVFVAISYLKNKILEEKLLSIKNTIIAIIILLIMLFVARSKIVFFFVDGAADSENMFSRPALYVKGFDVLMDYPVFGSGFGSFATYASGEYYSPLYYKYNLDTIFGLEPDNCLFISDTFYPVLVQFGFVGIFLFFYFWYRRIKTANILRKYGYKNSFLISLLISVLFAIDSVADSTLIQNRGVFLMMIMGVVLSRYRRYFNTQSDNFINKNLK